MGDQLHGGPSGDDLTFAHGEGGQGIQGYADLSRKGGVVMGSEGLHVIFRTAYHQRIYIDSGYTDKPGIQAAMGDYLFHLNDDLAAGIVGGLGLGKRLGIGALFFKGAVAVTIGIGCANHRDVDREGWVKQLLLTLKLNELDQIARVPGRLVDLSPLQAGVHEGVQADMRYDAGTFRRDFAE